MAKEDTDYDTDLQTMRDSYACNMKSFKEYYTLTKMYPTDKSYTDGYNNARKNLIQLSKNLFLLNNLIQQDIDALHKQSVNVNKTIQESESKKSDIMSKLNFLSGEVNGAIQMSQDYKALYVQQYVSNIAMIIGIIASFGATYYVFNKRVE